jgi:hypothetical protein
MSTSARPRLRRPLLLAWTGLLLAVVGLNAPSTAQAAPAATITVIGTTMSPYGALQVDSVSGFAPNEALTFTLDGTDVTDQLVVTTTDGSGSISQILGNLHFPTPSGGSVGSHTLTAADASASHTASITLQVIPSPVPTPATVTRTVSQMTSTGVKMRFDGFLPGETVTFGMANQVSGSECGAPVTVDASGTATATCIWNAAYVARFGVTPVAGSYTIGGSNSIFTIYSDAALVDVVADPVVTPPASTPPASAPPSTPVAHPAVPVRDRARFTG